MQGYSESVLHAYLSILGQNKGQDLCNLIRSPNTQSHHYEGGAIKLVDANGVLIRVEPDESGEVTVFTVKQKKDSEPSNELSEIQSLQSICS